MHCNVFQWICFVLGSWILLLMSLVCSIINKLRPIEWLPPDVQPAFRSWLNWLTSCSGTCLGDSVPSAYEFLHCAPRTRQVASCVWLPAIHSCIRRSVLAVVRLLSKLYSPILITVLCDNSYQLLHVSGSVRCWLYNLVFEGLAVAGPVVLIFPLTMRMVLQPNIVWSSFSFGLTSFFRSLASLVGVPKICLLRDVHSYRRPLYIRS